MAKQEIMIGLFHLKTKSARRISAVLKIISKSVFINVTSANSLVFSDAFVEMNNLRAKKASIMGTFRHQIFKNYSHV